MFKTIYGSWRGTSPWDLMSCISRSWGSWPRRWLSTIYHIWEVMAGPQSSHCGIKKSKKEDPGNYRPVSVTSVPSKIIEHILLKTMLRHMENREVICDSQHSFTTGKWCLANLVAFFFGDTALLNEGRATDIIHLDSCKAFDAVLHNILISKLERHGFPEWATWWIRNCLVSQTPSDIPRG